MRIIDTSLWHDLIAPGIAAIAGTLAGAVIALWADRHNRERKIEDEHVTATNKAIFAMVRIWNDLDGYRRQHVEEQRTNPDRWYTLRPVHLPTPVPFDTSSLAYLFELEGDTPTVPLEVDIELSRYASIYEVANFRNQIHEREAQPAIERGQQTFVGQMSLAEMIERMTGGPRVKETLRGLTDDLISLVDETLRTMPNTAAKLRSVAKAKYPHRQIIRFLPLPPPQTPPAS